MELRAPVRAVLTVLLGFLAIPSFAEGQQLTPPPARDLDGLALRARLGDKVFITNQSGDVLEGTFRGVAANRDVLFVGVNDVVMRLPATGIREVRREVRDSTWDGAWKGTGIAVGIGLLLAAIADDAEYVFVFYPAFFGFAAGAAIDMAVKDRELVFRRINRAAAFSLSPRLSPLRQRFAIGATIVW